MRNVKNRKYRVPFLGKLCSALLCAVITVTAAGDAVRTVDASSSGTDPAITALQDKIAKYQKQNEERKKQISSLQGDVSGNKQAMQLLNDQINGIKDEITAANELINVKIGLIDEKNAQIESIILTISDKEKKIEEKKDEIADLEEQNRQNLEKFAKLARAMYMKNPSDMIPVLSGSDDWYNYFVYSDVVKNISGQNALFMQRLQNSIKQQELLIQELDASILQLQSDKADLEEKKVQFEKEKADLEAEKERLNAYAAEQLEYFNQLASKNSQLQNQISALQIKNNENAKEIEACNAEIDRLIREAQQANSGTIDYNDGTYLWPLPTQFRTISTYFGYDAWRGGNHGGLDICGGGIQDANIYAIQSGKVILISETCDHNYGKNYYHNCGTSLGNYIVIDHGGGITTLYGHCAPKKFTVKVGQTVNKGDVIAHVGSTGWSTGFHLHFEVRKNNVKTDPFKLGTYTYKN